MDKKQAIIPVLRIPDVEKAIEMSLPDPFGNHLVFTEVIE